MDDERNDVSERDRPRSDSKLEDGESSRPIGKENPRPQPKGGFDTGKPRPRPQRKTEAFATDEHSSDSLDQKSDLPFRYMCRNCFERMFGTPWSSTSQKPTVDPGSGAGIQTIIRPKPDVESGTAPEAESQIGLDSLEPEPAVNRRSESKTERRANKQAEAALPPIEQTLEPEKRELCVVSDAQCHYCHGIPRVE